MAVKILHCADIHLDSPFSLSSPSQAERRRIEMRSAFTSAVMYARHNGAQLFLISGDLFDGRYVTKDTTELLISEFNSLPDCRFFISPGNHDPINDISVYTNLPFPKNVHIFGEQKEKVELPELGVDVYGVGFTSDFCLSSPVVGYGQLNPDRINILVCHGEVGVPGSKDGPISKNEIAASGFDYIALGHIHKPSGLLKEGNTYYCYPGCLEGRGFDELGYRGAMFGTVYRGEIDLKAVQFSKKRYEITTVDISGINNKSLAIDEIRKKIKEYINDTALRIILTGEVGEGFVISPAEIGQGYEYPYYIEIIDRTVPIINMTELENDTTLKGVFYNKMKDRLAACKPESDEYQIVLTALKYGISALQDRGFIDFEEGTGDG